MESQLLKTRMPMTDDRIHEERMWDDDDDDDEDYVIRGSEQTRSLGQLDYYPFPVFNEKWVLVE